MDVTINERSLEIPTEIDTWGDLLDWLETAHLKAGQCITHVYMDGSEALNYRDPLICDQELTAVGKVAVKSGDFDSVVRESLEELDQELAGAIGLSQAVVRLLESRNEQEAYNQLAQLLDLIRVFYTVFSEDLGWDDELQSAMSRLQLSTALDHALTQLITAQENRYWVAICDVVEYEIVPIIESWQKLVERTRVQIS
jgi:hypothetical protein